MRPRQIHPVAITLAIALTIFPLGCAVHDTTRLQHLPFVEVNAQLALHDRRGFDSPSFSPDGTKLVVLVEQYIHPYLPFEVGSVVVAQRAKAGDWKDLRVIRQGRHQPLAGRMQLPVQPSFDATGSRVIITQISFDSLLTIPWLCTMRSSVDSVDLMSLQAKRLVSHGAWGLSARELLQHARWSPNGRWLAFYVRERPGDQGIYLLDKLNSQQTRLSDQLDKHPTWSPDGTRIYFHSARGGRRGRFDPFASGIERSVIGFFERQTDLNGQTTWTRHLMDEWSNQYVYHKHPATPARSGLLFFHGRVNPGDKMKLLVRKGEPGSSVFEVKVRYNKRRMKALKHACSSRHVMDLAFVAKPKGSSIYEYILTLDEHAIKTIAAHVHRRDGGTGEKERG